MAAAKEKVASQKTQFAHVERVDIHDTGSLREVAIMKRFENGSFSYIDTALLDQLDKSRLKGIVQSVHADKYDLWELCEQTTLSNGLNALDYFHQMVRTKFAPGHVAAPAEGLGYVKAVGGQQAQVGAEFSDPSSAVRQ